MIYILNVIKWFMISTIWYVVIMIWYVFSVMGFVKYDMMYVKHESITVYIVCTVCITQQSLYQYLLHTEVLVCTLWSVEHIFWSITKLSPLFTSFGSKLILVNLGYEPQCKHWNSLCQCMFMTLSCIESWRYRGWSWAFCLYTPLT